MKAKFNFSISLVLVIIIITGCKNSSTVTPPAGDNNLIPNPSFEINGSPSLQGWGWSFKTDTSAYNFSGDVPPNGGKYSVVLIPNWGPAITLSSTVSATTGTHIYEFSVWAKRIGVSGGMVFSWKKQDSLIRKKSLTLFDTVWTNYKLIDTLNSTAGDSIVVSINGGFSQLQTGQTFFDLCKLTER